MTGAERGRNVLNIKEISEWEIWHVGEEMREVWKREGMWIWKEKKEAGIQRDKELRRDR